MFKIFKKSKKEIYFKCRCTNKYCPNKKTPEHSFNLPINVAFWLKENLHPILCKDCRFDYDINNG